MAKLTLRPRNFDKVAAKLHDQQAIAASLRDVFTQGGQLLERDVEKHRPTDGGLSAIGPFQKRVGDNSAVLSVSSLKSFDVARALNYGHKYRYSQGPFAGKPTAGWFTDAPKRVRAGLGRLLAKAARALESNLKAD